MTIREDLVAGIEECRAGAKSTIYALNFYVGLTAFGGGFLTFEHEEHFSNLGQASSVGGLVLSTAFSAINMASYVTDSHRAASLEAILLQSDMAAEQAQHVTDPVQQS